jgi:putative membrane protein
MMNELNRGWELGYGWIIGIIILIIILILVVVNQKKNSRRIKEKSPIEIIRERYAKGEISKEEFEEKRRTII